MNSAELQKIKANIFPAAWPAICDPENFDWHISNGRVDTWQQNSSQALCIDVFGTLSRAADRDLILSKIAECLGIPDDGPWGIELEWVNHGNPLNEKQRSQIDAVAVSNQSVILFECKFTEKSGACSQTQLLSKGSNKGLPQCNGNYELQSNPHNSKQAYCALTGKKIRYWDYIPALFQLDSKLIYCPCPFRGEWYQLMRNLTLAAALREKTGKMTAAALIYAAHPKANTSRWLQSPDWAAFKRCLKSNSLPFVYWSYASLLEMIQSADLRNGSWGELAKWVAAKNRRVFEEN